MNVKQSAEWDVFKIYVRVCITEYVCALYKEYEYIRTQL